MKALVIEDSKILIPNKEHKNFTESADIIEAESIVEGNRKDIKGLRKGEPFTYKLFITDKNQLIYLNKIKPMEATEVTLGADAGQTPTVINVATSQKSNQKEFIGAIVGGVAGFLYCRHKKHDLKKTAMYIAGGAALGYGVAYFILDKGKRSATVKASK